MRGRFFCAFTFFLLSVSLIPYAVAQTRPVIILSNAAYADSLGNLHVVGEVQNVGLDPLQQVGVVANLCDESRQPTGILEDYVMIDLLMPQQKSPFDLAQNSTATVCGVVVGTFIDANSLPYRDFSVFDQSASWDSARIYHVVGQVNNTGSSDAEAVEVVAAFYDDYGVVVQVGSGFVSPIELAAGESGSFDVASDNPALSARITAYSLQVQSASPVLPIAEYFSIPPAIMVAMILVLLVPWAGIKLRASHNLK